MRPGLKTPNKARAVRYELKGLVVSSKTIGTQLSYPLDLNNVSQSGMLLAWEQNRYVPFIENTILEMTIDAKQQWLKEPLHCMGKVVRRLDHDEKLTYFGVHIVQMDSDDLSRWDTCLKELSKNAVVVTNNLPSSDESVA